MTEKEIDQLRFLTSLPEWAAVRAWFRYKESEIVYAIKEDPGDLVNPQRLRLLDEVAQELSANG